MDDHGATLNAIRKREDFADLILRCQGHDFKVHKAVVCAQSPVINAAITNDFQEARTSMYQIHESFDRTTVDSMVQFMYGGGYSLGPTSSAEESEPITAHEDVPTPAGRMDSLLKHIRVNSIGDYFGLDKLVVLANERVMSTLHEWTAVERFASMQIAEPGPSEPQDTTQSNDSDAHSVVSSDNNIIINNNNDNHPLGDNTSTPSLAGELPQLINLTAKLTGDKRIINILAYAAVKNLGSFLVAADFCNIGNMADLSTLMLKHCNKSINKLQEDLANTVTAAALHQTSLIRENSRLAQPITASNKTRKCRHCAVKFNCHIDQDEYVLRCRVCRCRHPLS